ncbi:MAG: SDR family NAD(P)-dependent oxidoreductase [Bellilinea sp.]
MRHILPKSMVLITAAAGGLGKAFAAECASRGWDLFLTDIRSDLLKPLAEGLTRMYPVKVAYFPADLTVAEDRDILWREIDRLGLCFNFIINIAGMEYEGAFSERSIDELRTILRLNVEAGVEMTSQVLRRRVPDSPLYILNVSSLAGFYPMPMKAVYAASKRFIIDYSLALREELRSSGGHVTVLCPAGLPTSERSIKGIERQGIIGQITMKNVGAVAYRAIQLTLADRPVYIPGFVNRFVHFVSSFVPPGWKTTFIWRRWHKAHLRAARPADLTNINKSDDNPLISR